MSFEFLHTRKLALSLSLSIYLSIYISIYLFIQLNHILIRFFRLLVWSLWHSLSVRASFKCFTGVLHFTAISTKHSNYARSNIRATARAECYYR